jgi:predicted RNase H-like HicB family nuclease
MTPLKLKSVVWRDGKHYVAQCLNVDVSSFGKTRRTALKNLDEALALYFEDTKFPTVATVERAEVVPLLLQRA